MNDSQIETAQIPVLGFVAYSGSGKTTLLTRIIPKLNLQGIRIGVVKHAHHHFDIDKPGKDSYVLRQAGARQTLIASRNRWALMVETPTNEQDPALAELIGQLDQKILDLVLVEGFKHTRFPKVEVHRMALNKPFLYPQDPDIIALVTDQPATENTAGRAPIPTLDINNEEQIVQFVLNFVRDSHD